VLGVPAGEEEEAQAVWEASVYAGIPIVVWLRSGVQKPPSAPEHLYQVLTGKPFAPAPDAGGEADPRVCSLPRETLRDLPLRVFQLRKQAGGVVGPSGAPALRPLGECLALFWDDPSRLPRLTRAVSV
jgi:hypothetical protein